MLDSDADICRRAWVHCLHCADHDRCSTCREGRSCESHWRYLLASTGRHLFVQCPACLHRWWHDTRFGQGPPPLAPGAELDPWPASQPSPSTRS